MNRRSFLKNTIGALLFGAIGNNIIAQSIIDVNGYNPHDILLYLIRNKNGKLKIHGTKWVDIAIKNVSPFKFQLETFKPLGVFKSDIAYQKKRELWKEYNCDGICAYVNYEYAVKRGIEAKKSGQLKSISANGGSAGGKVNRDNKHGLFALTKEQKSIASRSGALISYPKMLQWCRDNNHWETLANTLKDVPKSKEHKEKISVKLKGRKLSTETCQKMSESRIGLVHSNETINKLKSSARKRCTIISQYDLNENWIMDWNGLVFINEELGLNKRSVQLVCNFYRDNLTKGSKQCGGYIWKYK